jgi:adsorption protein B
MFLVEAAAGLPAVFATTWQYLLGSLSSLLLISGIDDLLPLLICTWQRFQGKDSPFARPVDNEPYCERQIAIFVPCWDESEVIAAMIRQNVARIRYSKFHFFLGVYPNDQRTCDAAFDVASEFQNVHVAVVSNNGPTSKADCLNAIFEGMVRFEVANGLRFDTIVLHDAEDVIHADALSTIDRERQRYEMVQVPVLPLPTAPADFTHGIYCDEFAEFQLVDMRARQYSRSFMPSNGVGTGFSRDVLEDLSSKRGGQVFDPSSLTEDYDIGVQIHQAGFQQCFYPLERGSCGLLATREYFPRRVGTAIRQRTRWITGIALQCWQRHGWRGSLSTRYWFWRDRKGLITNPLSLLTNLVFLAGLTDWVLSVSLHRPWWFAVANPLVTWLCVATASLQVIRLLLRSLCVTNLYGAGMGATVLFRCFHANFVNCVASLCALRNYTIARVKHSSLKWDKTDHIYPTQMTTEISESGD